MDQKKIVRMKEKSLTLYPKKLEKEQQQKSQKDQKKGNSKHQSRNK